MRCQVETDNLETNNSRSTRSPSRSETRQPKNLEDVESDIELFMAETGEGQSRRQAHLCLSHPEGEAKY